MRGLLRNNFYAALSSAKWLAVILAVGGLAVVIVGKSTPLILYGLLCTVGFASNSVASLRKESASKWARYKLTMPVQRADIVKSQFYSHLLWILVGSLLTSLFIGLAILFHGFIFDVANDILAILTAGISTSLLMGSLFYPLYYWGGDERNEIILGASIVGAVGIFYGFSVLVNIAFGSPMERWEVTLGMAIVLVVSAVLLMLSYLITAKVFRKKEC